MPLTTLLARIIEGWAVLGLVVGIAVAVGGAARLDPLTRTGSRGFRALVVPGALFLWPWLVARMIRGPRT